ncbi:MAG: site-specific DNA-methyltransferase [Puniceicoccaceae bacterium]|nr:MAG: site-specific DNA-methyltransferase [Puniceicoccaceae bacterium]
MPKPVKSIRHTADKRAHTPSSEEAGYEEANPHVQDGDQQATYPRNPVVHRGQDPELWWLGKYGAAGDDGEAAEPLQVDIRSLYRHEHIAPEALIKGLYRIVEEKAEPGQDELFSVNELFGNSLERDELEKVSDYYTHSDGWSNRLIQGDSLLVMNSLLEREGMAGQVQCIYIDPPYGIKYGSNWQIKLNDRNITDGKDDHLSGEPEQIKAFRDTWELGIHSYLSYLRDRLIVAKELLHESGSCFVQISDENVHLVRCLMDEVLGSENFVSQIAVQKTGGAAAKLLPTTIDLVIWYARDKNTVKYRQLYEYRATGNTNLDRYDLILTKDGSPRRLSPEEIRGEIPIGEGERYQLTSLLSDGETSTTQDFNFDGKTYRPRPGTHWKTTVKGLERLASFGRIEKMGKTLRYRRLASDFPVVPITDRWDSMQVGVGLVYVVQTAASVIQRCLLMTTDPGDLVLDPTCGSGTTAYVAEQWGRRWITTDTSRIALNIAKARLMTATFPYYHLHSDVEATYPKDFRGKPKITPKPEGSYAHDIREGFVYEKVPHITLGSIANDEPPATETLYDRPHEDNKRMRVAGPFTVETLQNYEPISPEALAAQRESDDDLASFEDLVFEHLSSAGVKTGDKKENAVFTRLDRLASANLHADGFYQSADGEKKAYLHIGPKFGTVSKRAVNEAVRECRQKGDAPWLLILGFSFESGIQEMTKDLGLFQVSIVRMHDDLMQEGLLKKDKKAASFVTIGEPDIALVKDGDTATIEIRGLDIYDPIKDIVKSRDAHDIAYWMLDDDYDGSNFVVRQVFFCGGEQKEFDKWRKGLESLAKQATRKRAQTTLKVEIDEEAFDQLYGHQSRPFKIQPKQKIAIRVISQFGEETTKVMEV